MAGERVSLPAVLLLVDRPVFPVGGDGRQPGSAVNAGVAERPGELRGLAGPGHDVTARGGARCRLAGTRCRIRSGATVAVQRKAVGRYDGSRETAIGGVTAARWSRLSYL